MLGELGGALRAALGAVALRIDHIGSTAVAGLAAMPIIDVQISVAAFEPIEAFKDPLEQLGYVYRADNPERTKQYFREAPGSRRTHLHVRRAGSFSQQIPLLLRDYLRSHVHAAAEFAIVKRRLAGQFPFDGAGYTDAKALTSGSSSAGRTSGPSCKAGSRDQAMPESGAITGGDEQLRAYTTKTS